MLDRLSEVKGKAQPLDQVAIEVECTCIHSDNILPATFRMVQLCTDAAVASCVQYSWQRFSNMLKLCSCILPT
ncbi:hypothetical protein PsorP6_009422 [Peronosclerospora sorghi]|uniref:Uncharacterized protein n=1 Tax=Peronosclerospora sorghi TaxID=230839 RepID=A0ACC0W1H2_9STRA|nr:hypothetical protein PsorP6_009422 [Peronosclerospora sorghi]